MLALSDLTHFVPEAMKAPLRPVLARRKARQLAKTSKRLDICASQIAHCLHLAGGLRVEGKTCVELGAGWLLTHSLIMYLLGAKRIIATDLFPFFCPSELTRAVRGAVTALPRDILAPFCDHSEIRQRLDKLLSVDTFDNLVLRSLGIEYRCPVDLARERLDVPIDFAFSLSVLEHVPTESIRPLLTSVTADIKPGGCMIHCIHLEDHRNFNAPFDFYTEPATAFDSRTQTIRGNRIRRSEWATIFNELPLTNSRELYAYRRTNRPVPAAIDGSIKFVDDDDLRITHLGVLTTKSAM
jgi:hypothetical protein